MMPATISRAATMYRMPSGSQPDSGPFARAVAGEIRAAMARHRVSGAQLARDTARSQSYLSKRLRDEAAFTLNDVEDICRELGEPVASLLARALRSMGDLY